MVRVAQISFHRDAGERPPRQLLAAWPTLMQLAGAARAGGAEVHLVQASAHAEQFEHGGIACSFGPLDDTQLRAALAGADVLHVQGLGFARQVLALSALAEGRPIVLQDRADRPPMPWRRGLWRGALGAARGLLFCAREQAQPFARRGLIGPGTRVYELPGSSSGFVPRDRAEARRRTGLRGDPALLWVAHLDANKDPLAVLDGLAMAAHALPDPQLWCCYGQAPQLDAVLARIAGDRRLAGRVHLLGAQPHARIEWLMAAADLLVQGSHREATGYSVVEALACGLPPLVTDIPAFRAVLGDTPWPSLWTPGRPEALAAALQAIGQGPQAAWREAARRRFDAELSPAALGRRLTGIYRDLLA